MSLLDFLLCILLFYYLYSFKFPFSFAAFLQVAIWKLKGGLGYSVLLEKRVVWYLQVIHDFLLILAVCCSGLPLICLAFWDMVICLNGACSCDHLPPCTVRLLAVGSVPAPGRCVSLLPLSFPSVGLKTLSGSSLFYTGAEKSKGATSNSCAQHTISVSSELCFGVYWT